jgi:CelD/BcsL family acetyltransferase involved in cellulose biosynthesis
MTVELRMPAMLTPQECAKWDGIYQKAADRNLFAHPAIVRTGLQHCGGDAARLAWVCDATGALVAVLPLTLGDHIGRMPSRHLTLWSHPNSFCTTALVRNGQEAAIWPALFAAAARDRWLASGRMLMLPALPADSRLNAGVRAAAAALNLPFSVVESHARAVADGRASDLADYWDHHVRAKKRKEVRRQWARLNECGTVCVDALSPRADAGSWIDEFLALERSGWKGTAGSALAEAPGTAAFFHDVVLSAHRRRQLCFTAIRLDGRAIAMLVTLIDGSTAFSFKTAYDESLARFSPGVLIQRETLPILASRGVNWIDSCAAPNHPMIDSLWDERRTMETLLLPFPGIANRLSFTFYQAIVGGWHLAKNLRGRRQK